MSIKKLLAITSVSIISAALSTPAYAGYFLQINKVDPKPQGENIGHYTNTSLRSCELRCRNNPNCWSYYWVRNLCWLKSSVQKPEQKSFEDGVGGIWIE